MSWQTENGEELYLYANNDGKLYERELKPAYRKLEALAGKNQYTRAKAMAVFKPIMSHAVDMYHREINRELAFSPADKTEAAETFAEYFEAEYKLGNMPH